MKTFALIIAVMASVITTQCQTPVYTPIKNGRAQTDFDMGGHKLTNVVDVTDASGNSLLGGGGGGGTGNVSGPNSATLNEVAAFADTTGKLLKGTGIQFANIALNAYVAGVSNLWINGSNNLNTAINLRPTYSQSASNVAGGLYITSTRSTAGNGALNYAVDMTIQNYKDLYNAYTVNIGDRYAWESDFELHTNALAPSAYGDASGLISGLFRSDFFHHRF